MNEKEILNKLDQIEEVMEELQQHYEISGSDKFAVIYLLDDIKELI